MKQKLFGLCRAKSPSPLLFCLEHTNDPAHHDPLRTQKSRSAFVTTIRQRTPRTSVTSPKPSPRPPTQQAATPQPQKRKQAEGPAPQAQDVGDVRSSMRKITQQQSVLKKNLRIVDARQNTRRERERERGTQNVSIKNATITMTTNQPLQKVTKSLYIVTNLGQLPFMLFT